MDIKERHFTYNKVTRKITFKKNEERYEIEKKIFAKHDVDIDAIDTVDEYDKLRLKHFEDILAATYQYWYDFDAVSIEDKYLKSVMLEDFDEMLRLKKVRIRQKSANIRIVK